MRSSSFENDNFLKQIPLFSGLTESEIQKIESVSCEKIFLKDTVIINEGDETNSLYIILKGRANALSMDPGGRQIILNVFRPGDYFGEMSFIDAKPRSAAVITKEKSKFVVIKREAFLQIVSENPELMLNMMKGLVGKIRVATRQIEDLAFKDVYGRIARLLTELKNGDGVVTEKLTNTEIAFRVGASREMVSRIVSELKNGGYIDKNRGVIQLKKSLPYQF
ncbi:Crp/Fnr family transcriptional regulator [uncultured Desulfobacter sp.]|uniref:Crp/Fnr family transcriptional regulator n=1 Tax=uncultured Desulfobacter sp. TaxID=240139 RepID=UPI0029F48A05|nr:Crp/Fnr family transcriptional regulator [uncultured Desulfobacter sp.]